MKRWKKILIGLVITISLLGGIGYLGLQVMMKSVGMAGGDVADYDKRIGIWDSVAGNSKKSKLDDMAIKSPNANFILSTFQFLQGIVGKDYQDNEEKIDTFTYLFEIKQGFEKETYEDAPYLIPYLQENSRGAVIVIPGGGFGYKSMDGSTSEGKDIAMELNKAGYSAFVLHYRSNPYEYPIPQIDVQRAVRFLRYHAEDYQISPDKIGLIGFSAGGNQVGTYINMIMGKDLFPHDYQKDDIDAVDDNVIAPAMIYPALSYKNNVPMLFAMFNDEEVRDERKREDLLELTDLKNHLNPKAKQQFIAYGDDDQMVGLKETEDYIKTARENGIDVTDVLVKGGQHGFAYDNYGKDYIKWLNDEMQ
ncbi:alpha/beta hydrolase [Streptococcus saliviloxodontae]|uniref:Acetyl esterase/lipase n=1 Tax=Streptococcus saliviloxodontae TaxID=1349416 RepID=A0ABS2PNF5_9STRE|nr:alpha/beta hydrolase [Streptococcus saliviloxodontae]MBM7636969.1 acetyl esterase/lipase [Streptococcus saliviloxodontae]